MKTELNRRLSNPQRDQDRDRTERRARQLTIASAIDYAKQANVPGFRPGHAPRAVVRTRFKNEIRS